MAMSPDDLRKTLNDWKSDSRILRMLLLQDGHTTLWAIPTAWSISEEEVRFSFGFTKLAWGDVVIPFSDLLSIDLIDPASRPLEPSASEYESCIEFTWKYLDRRNERCIVCLQKKP